MNGSGHRRDRTLAVHPDWSEMTTDKHDVHADVTNAIIEHLEKGVRPWTIPWTDGQTATVTRPLRHNGEPFSGANVLRLWLASGVSGYRSPFWFTFNQARKKGGRVRKGQKAVGVVLLRELIRKEHDAETGEEVETVLYFPRGYRVFNAEQIDGLPDEFLQPASAHNPVGRIEAAEQFIKATGADIRHSGDEAWYDLRNDCIQLPPRERFHDAEGYYGTLCHELTHWTRHKDRLDRSFGHQRFGDAGYAMEELVAELGSAFLGADLGIAPAVREDHAAYIGAWLKVLRDDNRAIFSAANHAQRAVDYLASFSRKTAAEATAAVKTSPKPSIEAAPAPGPAVQIEFDFYGGPHRRRPRPDQVERPLSGSEAQHPPRFGRRIPVEIFAEPYSERFSPLTPIVRGTKLEHIDPEDNREDDYGIVVAVDGAVAEVDWKGSGERVLVPVGELWDFVVEDWTRDHWGLIGADGIHAGA